MKVSKKKCEIKQLRILPVTEMRYMQKLQKIEKANERELKLIN